MAHLLYHLLIDRVNYHKCDVLNYLLLILQISLFGGSAWKWNDQRKQFYLHHFAVEQPDLNFSNTNVVGNMSVSGLYIFLETPLLL